MVTRREVGRDNLGDWDRHVHVYSLKIKTTQLKNVPKTLTDTSAKKRYRCKHVRRCPTWHVPREMQIKTRSPSTHLSQRPESARHLLAGCGTTGTLTLQAALQNGAATWAIS